MSLTILITCVLLLVHFTFAQELLNYRDVDIDSGTVRGLLADNCDYFAFLGIPYAAAPVGNRRFKSPLPPKPWKNIFLANRKVKCPQNGQGDEDCLIINVFTPTNSSNASLPVLVYIHGGSFVIGSGQTEGVEPLVKQNLIVVTINYRLGALGFLCLGTTDAPGNAGIKDQVAALKWVQRNIAQFDGDPNNVTIYGMSAGGASVEILIASKMAAGLFQKAIVESGAASAVWSIDADPIKTAWTLAPFLNVSHESNDCNELYNYYKTANVDELTKANYELYRNLTDGTGGFVPCLERKLVDIEPLLTNTTTSSLKQNEYNKVPVMFVFVTLEGLFFKSSDYYELNFKDRMNHAFQNFLPADLEFGSEAKKEEISANIKDHYFGNKSIGDDSLKEYLDFFGDHLVLHGLLNSVLTHSQNDDIVYLLEFAYKGKLGSNDSVFENVSNAGHGDAVKYAILNKPIGNEEDKLVVDRMATIIANFAEFGNPNPSPSPLIPISWPAVKLNNVTYLRLDKDVQVLENPSWDRKLFWDRLYDLYRKPVRQVEGCLASTS